MLKITKKAPKGLPGKRPRTDLFRESNFRCTFGCILAFVAPLWLHFAPLCLHFASLWLHFGSPWLPFGSILNPFDSFLREFAQFVQVHGQMSHRFPQVRFFEQYLAAKPQRNKRTSHKTNEPQTNLHFQPLAAPGLDFWASKRVGGSRGAYTIIPKSCPNHAQIMSKSCPNHAQIMPKSCPNHAQIMPKSCPNHVRILPNSCLKHC